MRRRHRWFGWSEGGRRPRGISGIVVACVALGAACTDPVGTVSPSAAKGGGSGGGTTAVTVTAVSPSSAGRDTTLDVVVTGTSFDDGSQVQLVVAGTTTSSVRTNSTRYVKSTQLVANVTVPADADVGSYDVLVTTRGGKKGMGSEMFRVLLAVPAEDLGSLYVGDNGATLAPESVGHWVNAAGWVLGTTMNSEVSYNGFLLDGGSSIAAEHLLPSTTLISADAMALGPGAAYVIGTYQRTPNYGVLWASVDGGQSWGEPDSLRLPAGMLGGTSAEAVNEYGAVAGKLHPVLADGTPLRGIAAVWPVPGDPPIVIHDALLALNPAYVTSSAYGINAAGAVAGFAARPPTKGRDFDWDAFVWTPGPNGGTVRLLPVPSGTLRARANAINDDGVIVGYLSGKDWPKPARWRPDGLGGYSVEVLTNDGEALDVNAQGDIVYYAGQRSWLYRGPGASAGQTVELLPVVPRTQVNVQALSDRAPDGLIYATGMSYVSNADGSRHAVRWAIPPAP